MSFGFGVGDFIAVFQLVNEVRKEFVGAPSQFKDVSDEVRSLSIVLQDAELVVSEREPNSQEKADLKDIIDGCQNVLSELKHTLDKYRELGAQRASVSKKVKRAWKRLDWDPQDVRELRGRISLNITLLNGFNGRITRDNTVRLVRYQEDEERQAIFDWLTLIDYTSQQNDFLDRRQAGTGQWLLDSAEFKTWVETNKQTLFCPGIPGAGKTILTSIVVEELSTRFQDDSSIAVAYLYCNFRRQDEQRSEDLLASLLKQLAQGWFSVPESVKSLYDRHKVNRTRPSVDEISKTLQSVAAMYSRVFILVDALDECQVNGGCRSRLLSEIFGLQTMYGINLFTTSRFIPEITEKFKRDPLLEIRASEQDVQRYIDGHISHLPSFVGRNLDLQNEIKTEIVKAVDGMFLLALLHLDSLIGKRSPKAVRTALEKLPAGSEAYDRAYNDAMERIEGQVSDQEELAKQVLEWITCAKRPLTTLELQHALAVEVGEAEFDEDNIPQIEDMLSVCAGLVTVDEESHIIRLVHYTTQEYFERTQGRWFPTAEADITASCVTYLSFAVFGDGFCQSNSSFEERLRVNTLYDYAARNWGRHSRQASTLYQGVIAFLQCDVKVEAAAQAMLASKHYLSNYSQRVPRRTTGLHLAAYFGMKEAVEAILQNGVNVDSKDSYGQTPLSWAAEGGHKAVVKALLETGQADVDSKDSYGQTPLSWAAEGGHEAVVKALLETGQADVDSKDSAYGRTPLWRAAEGGHEAVVKALLETGQADVDSKDSYGQTPLSRAAEGGHEAVVKALLETGQADVDSKDSAYGRTPLSWAAEGGHEAVVKLLSTSSPTHHLYYLTSLYTLQEIY